MVRINWTGNAQPVDQIETITVGGTVTIGDVLNVDLNEKRVSITTTTTSTATSASELQVALAASEFPEFQEITWELSGSTVTGTASRPFTIAVSKTGTATIATTTTQTFTGPNNVDNVDNFSGGALPTDGDDLVIADADQSLLYGWPAVAVDLASIDIYKSFGGQIGLPENNPLGYREYSDLHASNWHTSTLRIGLGSDGSGSQYISIDFDDSDVDVKAYATGTAAGDAMPVNLHNLGSNSTIDITAGAIAVHSGDPDQARIGQQARFWLDPNATLAESISSGTAELEGVTTTILCLGGSTRHNEPATTIVIKGGVCYTRQLDGAEAVTIGPGNWDLSELLEAGAPASITPLSGGQITDPNRKLTGTYTIITA